MSPDDPVCLCFHVTRRKIVNFIRVEKPQRPSQLSNCFGAGTGCGWCRSYLERMLANQTNAQFAGSPDSQDPEMEDISLAEYARQRAIYVREGGGTPPPGAVPVDEDIAP